MEAKKTFLEWVKEHKAELILTGVAAIGTILLVKNWEDIKGIIKREDIQNLVPASKTDIPAVTSVIDTTKAIQPSLEKITSVREHLRTLPEGYHPSPEKVLQAAKEGIQLLDYQTVVSSYTRRCAA